ncbi:MAG TPA: hypothetical protein PK970_10285 [Hyphomicrobiaceae bacterium]|mgnify:CR=1 FL=1|nr:hypothetical protein [Hyphomicrobiaceae bacterium]
MRRFGPIVLGGAALAVLSAAALYFWSRSAVPAQVEKLLAELGGPGNSVSHGPVSFDAWSRTVKIPALEIKSRNAPATGRRAGLITLEGVTPGRTGITAARAVVTDLVLATNDDTGALSVTIPTLELKNPSFDLSRPTRVPAETSDLDRIAANFERLEATAISTPNAVVNATPSSASRAATGFPGGGRVTLADVKFETVAAGRIARSSIASATIETGAGSPLVSATYGPTSVRDADVMVLAGYGTAGAGGSALVRAVGDGEFGPIAVRIADGTELTIDGGTVGATEIDPAKFSATAVNAIATRIEKAMRANDHEAARKLLADLGASYTGLSTGPSAVRNLRVVNRKASPEVDMGVARMTISAFERGKLREIALEGVKVDVNAGMGKQGTEIGKLAITGLDISGLMRAVSLQGPDRRQPTFAENMAVLSAIEGFEIADLAVTGIGLAPPPSIDRMKLQWQGLRGDRPLGFAVAFKGRVPLRQSDPSAAALRAMGFSDLMVDLDIGARHDATSGTLAIGPGTFGIGSIGTLKATARLHNVKAAGLATAPGALQQALADAALGSVEIALKDDGFVTIASQLAGVPDRNTLLGQIDALKQQSAAAPGSNPAFVAVIDAVRAFVSRTGSTFNLRFEPKTPVPMALIGAARTNPTAQALVQELLGQARIEARTE